MCVGHSKVFKVEEAVGVILSNQLDEPGVGWLFSAWIGMVQREHTCQ